MDDEKLNKHIELVHTIVPSLSASASVAFGLACFSRQRFVFESLVSDEVEKAWLTKVTIAENEWWKWCVGGSISKIQIGKEAHELTKLVQPTSNKGRVKFCLLGTCNGFFSGIEEGDFWCTKYTAIDNVAMIESLEDDLDIEDIYQLIVREISRQESELLFLKDGVFTDTRDKLKHLVPDQLLFGEISFSDELWQR